MHLSANLLCLKKPLHPMIEIDSVGIVIPATLVSKQMDGASRAEPILRKQRIVSGFEKELIEFLIKVEIVFIILRHVSNPLKWFKIFMALDPHRMNVLGKRRIKKIVKVDGKYYWGLFIPGWPSKIFHAFLKTEVNRYFPLRAKTNRLTNIFLAVTNKCPLACEHCYAWEELNSGEKLALPDLKAIVHEFQNRGVSQIHLSGGEPLVRVNEVIEVLNAARGASEFWILTSGFHLTAEKAKRLKVAGLTGVIISLDHFEAHAHNSFRGFKDSFQWVATAVENAIAAELVSALTICVTKSFVSEDNLMKYMDMAKVMGVSFVQILEPRATGHYKNQDVGLAAEQEEILDTFYLKLNYDIAYKEYPPISYHGYHQRRMGCLAAGMRSVYVDTKGDIHACPFCQKSTGNALMGDLDEAMARLQHVGCHKF